jgi:molecular chaperone DnaK (HSP70)
LSFEKVKFYMINDYCIPFFSLKFEGNSLKLFKWCIATEKRVTLSYVEFTEDEFFVGDSAKNPAAPNPANTMFGAKCLIGCQYSDPIVIQPSQNIQFNGNSSRNTQRSSNRSHIRCQCRWYYEIHSSRIIKWKRQ